ncbi:hypothetical protein [Candidatus Chloroploca sp. Khr17]|nr:hypothetical protein [Candidatus Chloroploca sp. Khr17]
MSAWERPLQAAPPRRQAIAHPAIIIIVVNHPQQAITDAGRKCENVM